MRRKNLPNEQIEANKPLDRKKVLPRLIVSLIFFVIALTAIAIGLMNMGRQSEGLQEIEAAVDKDVPYYELGVSFQHYFTGSSGEIRREVNELGALYSNSLKDAYRLFNAEEEYEGFVNLATVNENRGREITVPRELYAALKRADALTRAPGSVYNVYAGVLYSEWEALRYLLDPVPADPANESWEALRLERLAAATAELRNFSLEFLDDEACRLRFTVDQSYLALLEELEFEGAILDLNLLTDAFKLRLVADRVEARGYDRGFLSAESGLTLSLSAYKDGGDYCFYGQKGDEAVPAASRPLERGSCAAQLRAFATREEPGHYAVEQGSGVLLRHPWLPADGQFREQLLSCCVFGSAEHPEETVLAALALHACDSREELMRQAAALPLCALLLREEPETVYLTDASIRAEAEYGYSAKQIQ